MKKYAAEFIGTFSLVLFGCGSAVIAGISTAVSVPSATRGVKPFFAVSLQPIG